MSNSKYRKGYKKENALVNKFKALDWDICFRSAGSHSPIDVVVINKETREIKLIQSKPDTMSNNAKYKLEEEQQDLNGVFKVNFVVM